MPEPKPRRWFQVHLSTCIVLMFVAGLLALKNLEPWPYRITQPRDFGAYLMIDMPYGWPLPALLISEAGSCSGLHLGSLVVDVFAWSVVVGSVAFACEYFIRRRERQQP